MKNSQRYEELQRIFSDAQVLDVDLSTWDSEVVFALGVDHYRDWEGEPTRPTLLMRFSGVRKLSFEFGHSGMDFSKLLGPGEHIQWLIHESSIVENDGSWSFRLSAIESSPVVEIECSDVAYSEVAPRVLHAVFPDWNRVGAPLLRPGLIKMLQK